LYPAIYTKYLKSVKNILREGCTFVPLFINKLYVMKTRNLIIAVMLLSGIAFTSCQKDNSVQPASGDMMKSHQTGEIWSVEADPLNNYPDPFTDQTTIEYRLNKAGRVKLTISNGNYNSIAVLVDAYQEAGVYQLDFDGSDLEPGVYVVRLLHNNKTIREEMRKVAGTIGGNPLSN
jgi:hypothetical protein